MTASVPQPRTFRGRRLIRFACAVGLAIAVSTSLVLADSPAAKTAPSADAPDCPAANAGMPERLPVLPNKAPRPLTGAGSVGELVEGVTQNDATFEVLVGQGRILTTRIDLAVKGKQPALIAIGDPAVADFAVVSARQIRIEGKRLGVTDLSIVTPDNQTYSFEVRVVSDLHVLRGQLHCLFPAASLKLSQLRDHIVVEGEARDAVQVARIMETIQAYLVSVQAGQGRQVAAQRAGAAPPAPKGDMPPVKEPDQPGVASPEASPIRSTSATGPAPRVINLIRVPGAKQVLLKVRVAELNRTAFRQIGSDMLINNRNGTLIGTQIGGSGLAAVVEYSLRSVERPEVASG